ncbi:MAG: hypothetical protein FJ011_08215 [Chloroflexi bacterium]|nr:hypothetical protein [Chloroflexota bacterium]
MLNRTTALWGIIVTLLLIATALLIARPVVAATCTSQASGTWSASSTWNNCNGSVPQTGDDVVIADGYTVTLDTNASVASITVGQGTSGVLIFDSTAHTVTVAGSVTVNSGGIFITQASGAATHSLSIGGNLTNNGTFDMSRGGSTLICNVTFNKNGNQTISGTGSTTRFNLITLNMGSSRDNTLQISSSNFSVPSTGFIDTSTGIQNGTLRLSGSFSLSNRVFTGSSPAVIPATGGFWLDNANVTGVAWNGSYQLSGQLRVSAGTLNLGTTDDNSLRYRTDSVITLEGGTVSIAGRLARDTNSNSNTTTYNQSGGTITVVTSASTATTRAGFDIGASGSSFTMSGGNIVIQNATSNTDANGGDYFVAASTTNVTGGTLQVGNSSTLSGQTIRIKSSAPVYNLTVYTTNAPTAKLLTNALTVKGDVNIQSGATLDANNIDMNVAGNWTNNGTFTPGSGTVTFNGTTTISGSSTNSFNNVTISSSLTAPSGTLNVAGTWTNNGTFTHNSGTVTFNGTTTISGSSTNSFNNVTISSSLTAPSGTMNVAGNWTNNGTFTHSSGKVTFNRSGTSTFSGSSTTTFYDLEISSNTILDVSTNTLFDATDSVRNKGQLKQTQTVSSGAVSFLNVSSGTYYGLVITPTTSMGSTTVTIYGEQACSEPPNIGTGGTLIKRCYVIAPTSTANATTKFWYDTTYESNGLSQSAVQIFHEETSPQLWRLQGDRSYGSSGSDNFRYVQVGTTSYSRFAAGVEGTNLIALASFTAAPTAGGVLLTWETVCELDTAGFNLWRGDAPDGPYARINPTLIPAAGGPTWGASYTFTDATAADGAIHYYKLEEVNVYGLSAFHGPTAVTVGMAQGRRYLPLVGR